MHRHKMLTKEDAWRPADLRRYIRDEKHGGDDDDDAYVRRQDEKERKPRGGVSVERHRRDPEETKQERDIYRERDSTRDREKPRYEDKTHRRKEGSHDRRSDMERDRDREKTRERDRLVGANKYSNEYGEHRERRRDREEKRDKERDREEKRYKERDREEKRYKERDREKPSDRDSRVIANKYIEEYREHWERRRDTEEMQDKERDREKMRERDRLVSANKYSNEYGEHQKRRRDIEEQRDKERDRERNRYKEKDRHEDRSKSREERDKEKRTEEWDKERQDEKERRRLHENREGGSHWTEKHRRDRQREHLKEIERHRDTYEAKRRDKERNETDRKCSDVTEQRGHKEECRKDKEESERRHKERHHEDENWRRDIKSREHKDQKESGEDIRHRHGDIAQVEHSIYKESRHREGKDTEKTHKEKTTSKTSASHKSLNQNAAETEVAEDEDLVDREYEDDFEEYEEDFEEMDESANEDEEEKESYHLEVKEEREELTAQMKAELQAIQIAMEEENRRAQIRTSTRREEDDSPKPSRDSDKSENTGSHSGKRINFVAAKQREVSKKVASQQKKRSMELLRLIDLDFSLTFSLLDLPPVSEYDMYIRNFGNTNTKQAYVQCNEDSADRDIQTEEVEVNDKWTQHPPERNEGCGDPNLFVDDKMQSEMKYDSQRLTAFLRSASQVVVVLLEEVQAERNLLRKPKAQTDTLSFSDGSLQLNAQLSFLHGYHISLLHFSQFQKQTMLSVHKPSSTTSTVPFTNSTIICIWNIWEPSKPQKILVYESQVECCCFSPGKAMLVFAGTSDGCLVLWDLREYASNHSCLKLADEEWTFRQPTFSTAAVMGASGHFSSVTCVEVVSSTPSGGLRPEVTLLASEEESLGLSFQLASLDESGILNFWVVVELSKAKEADHQTNLGLTPGGKVKLLLRSSLQTAERMSPRDVIKTGPLQALNIKFLPADSNHFFIGTNMSLVSHGTSHGVKAVPKFYRSDQVGITPVEVTIINFSPFSQHLFLVGCSDGSIRLHAASCEHPVLEWYSSTSGQPVVSLQWSQTRPAVFCVLDAASNLYMWDLLKDDMEPVVTQRVNADRVTALAVFGDSEQQNAYSGIAMAHESGKIEICYFTRNFAVPSAAEQDTLESVLI
ncbi:WD repeat-containing protein 60 [Thalassophryne amazonica]|uniref:WD repeat-containing protein 60 n=1 Tax=Thalassophryne amazonica TaxID=390379 RepID=UPI0014721A41|nr:WD repeat-containing protein 60 [Thalassophryne amazonica]